MEFSVSMKRKQRLKIKTVVWSVALARKIVPQTPSLSTLALDVPQL
jgi:hypothetical protein